MMVNYEVTIGLEIHVQLATQSKMFCGCDNDAEGKAPNSVVCPVCLGMPGTLPVPNEAAIQATVKAGRFLGSSIAPLSKFDRKHYFYPDLPKGYQISQYDWPIARGGAVQIGGHKIGLTRIHLEEDTGKLIHPKGAAYSLVDLNRAGTPLMEVVTEPEIKTPAEAKAFLQRLRLVVRYLGIAAADMEKGQLRCDANVSIAESQKSKVKSQKYGIATRLLGTPVEIKNLNSFLMVEKALHFEIERQIELLKKDETITKETRGWDDARGVTLPQRSKEFAPDYRYFPEPDIPVLKGLDKWLVELPESIEKKMARARGIGISDDDIDTIFSDDKLMDNFDRVVSCVEDDGIAQKAVSLILNFKSARRLDGATTADIGRALNDGKIGPQAVRPLIDLILAKKISVSEALKTGDFSQISDGQILHRLARKVIADNPAAANDYHAGKKQALGFLVGQAMRASSGQAEPGKLRTILINEL